MATYIIKDSNSNEVNRVNAKTEADALLGQPAGYTAELPPATSGDPVTPARTWTKEDIREGMTLAERVSWDNNTDNSVTTAKIEMSQPQELAETTAVLDLLVGASVISADTKTAILA